MSEVPQLLLHSQREPKFKVVEYGLLHDLREPPGKLLQPLLQEHQGLLHEVIQPGELALEEDQKLVVLDVVEPVKVEVDEDRGPGVPPPPDPGRPRDSAPRDAGDARRAGRPARAPEEPFRQRLLGPQKGPGASGPQRRYRGQRQGEPDRRSRRGQGAKNVVQRPPSTAACEAIRSSAPPLTPSRWAIAATDLRARHSRL